MSRATLTINALTESSHQDPWGGPTSELAVGVRLGMERVSNHLGSMADMLDQRSRVAINSNLEALKVPISINPQNWGVLYSISFFRFSADISSLDSTRFVRRRPRFVQPPRQVFARRGGTTEETNRDAGPATRGSKKRAKGRVGGRGGQNSELDREGSTGGGRVLS